MTLTLVILMAGFIFVAACAIFAAAVVRRENRNLRIRVGGLREAAAGKTTKLRTIAEAVKAERTAYESIITDLGQMYEAEVFTSLHEPLKKFLTDWSVVNNIQKIIGTQIKEDLAYTEHRHEAAEASAILNEFLAEYWEDDQTHVE